MFNNIGISIGLDNVDEDTLLESARYDPIRVQRAPEYQQYIEILSSVHEIQISRRSQAAVQVEEDRKWINDLLASVSKLSITYEDCFPSAGDDNYWSDFDGSEPEPYVFPFDSDSDEAEENNRNDDIIRMIEDSR
ncbi:uncharacterized protein PAC_06317 [Phialocephala subalpina]|uniref:Uncharacterized protein n=1 Tax=Phialocephala subalpina TaxID=576137 RepID=A0A1L7WUJ0_9HELO|nr:uncharacterized protein PAC_06317 [Phialocephala subalpina]